MSNMQARRTEKVGFSKGRTVMALAILGMAAVIALAAAGLGTGEKMSAVTFHDAMRELWEDHATWTRLTIVSIVADLPDTQATVARLLQNQVDIGDAIKPFYGDAAGDQLTA